MTSLKNSLYAAVLLGITSQAYGVDLTTYPESILGPQTNAKAALAKGTVVCKMTGMLYMSGVPINYSGHVRLTHDGKQDANGFGHFTSPAGKESFVHYSTAFSTVSSGGSDGAGTCVHLLDTANSKYAVSKFGTGISELHWNADANNPDVCPAFVDQMGWVVDRTGHSITTKINDAPTTIRGEQIVDCYKAN